MPPRKKNNKKLAKRRNVYPPKPRVLKMGMLPDSVLFTFKYHENTSIAGGAATLGISQWRLNSINDPRYAVGGHQPMYHDAMLGNLQSNSLYHKYIVHQVDYVIDLINTDTNTEQSVIVFPTPHSNVPLTTWSFSALAERNKCQKRALGGNAGQNRARITGSVDIKRLEGESILTESVYGAAANTGPTRQGLLNVVVDSIPGGTATNTLMDITLYYKCKLYDRCVDDQVN